MPKPPPFIRVEIKDQAGEKLIVTQQQFESDDITIETTSKRLQVKRRDLQLALLSITEEG